MRDLFNCFKTSSGNEIAKKRFLPSPDYSGSRKYGILPNVSSLANIYARINKIEPDVNVVTLIHDEQKEFSNPLITIIDDMSNLAPDAPLLITPEANFNIGGKANFYF